MKTKELIEAVKNEKGSAFQNCRDCEYGTHNDEVIEKLNRLAELEDKIEKGTLIELKYSLFKAVYFLRNKAVEKGVIVSFKHNQYTNPKMWYTVEYYIPILKSHYVEEVREDKIYFTREEAEKRLKELQE